MRSHKRSELLECSEELVLADGSPLEVAGQVVADLIVGSQMFSHLFIVAELGDIDGIMGLDFMESYETDIRVTRGELVLNRQDIKLHRNELAACARVQVAETLEVPPRVEMVIPGRVSKRKRLLCRIASYGTVEGVRSLTSSTGLIMARALVSADKDLVPLSIVNMTDTPVTLKKGTVVALLQPVSSVVEQVTDPVTMATGSDTYSGDLPAHLAPLLEGISEDLSPEQLAQVKKVVMDYEGVFMGPDGKLGRTDLVKHTIDTGGAPPLKQAPRRVPLAQRQVMEEEISAMLEQDIIKPSNSPWASPVVLVKKKDGSVRFCVDYRRLNEISRKDAFPLPRCDECLETLHGAAYFSTLDCASGFWQVEMDPKDAYKTSFCTRSGLYEFKVMPYGLCNSPLTFQRLMEGLLRGLQWERALIYIDDVIVMGRTVP